MGWLGALGRIGSIGAWSLLAGALALKLLQSRRLRRRVKEPFTEAARAAEAVPETRFEDRDEAHRGGARYD